MVDRDFDEALSPELVMLYSHWVAADAIRVVVAAAVPGADNVVGEIGTDLAQAASDLSRFYRILVFYALLQVVVEAYHRLPPTRRDRTIDELLTTGPSAALRRLRNAVFHVQDHPFNPKLWTFLLEPDSEKWIRKLHRAFENYFRRVMPIDAAVDELRKLNQGVK